MILPDDFTPPQENAGVTEPQTSVEPEKVEPQADSKEVNTDTTPTEPKQESEQRIKIKYNSEEKELSLEEAKQLAQKGMNYEKAIERAEQQARDKMVAEQGFEWNGKPIRTEAEYKQALYEKQLQDAGYSPEQVNQMVEEHPEVKRSRELLAQQEKQKEYDDFFKNFPDTKAEDIPKEVWELRESQGKTLSDAMMYHESKQLKEQIKQLKHNIEILKQAPISQGASTHGVKDNVEEEDDFLKGFNSI